MSADTIPAPVPFVTTRYKCPFCNRARAHRKAAELHIPRCWKNPAMHGCKTCALFSAPKGCAAGFNLGPGLVTKCSKWKDSRGT